MGDNECITMLVCWNEQARQISFRKNDDFDTIEKTIYETFQSQHSNHRHEYQIQYYENEYQRYVDLYSDAFDSFASLKQRLLSSDVPKTSPEAMLRIVRRTAPMKSRSIHKSTVDDDNYTFQLANDPIGQEKHFSPRKTNEQSPISTTRSKRNVSQDVIKKPAPREEKWSLSKTVQSTTVHHPCLAADNHRYDLHFGGKLAETQRLQYESEMTRTKSDKTTKAGVYVQAHAPSSGAPDEKISYPTIYFDIPGSKRELPWSLIFYVLTQPDANGKQYIHTSKYLYDSNAERGRDASASTPSPLTVELCPEEIHDGTHQAYLKVCNMTELAKHRKERLEEFASLKNQTTAPHASHLSNHTTRSLELLSENYCLGCRLVQGGKVYDECISSMTRAVRAVKRGSENETEPKKATAE